MPISRAVDVQRKTFEKMLAAVETGIRSFGRPPQLSRADQLLRTLMYWREYRTEFHIGLTFGVREVTVCRTIQQVETAFANGKRHDFQLFKDSRSGMAEQIRSLGDAGYQGLAGCHANSQTPIKKSKHPPLTKEQKAHNRALSRERILVEHVIRSLKIFRIMSERERNRRKRFGFRFNLIAAIYNSELETPTE